MTQAINLANFANSLDTSGGVPPTQLNAPVPISKGGTNAINAADARTNLDVAQAVYSVPSGGIIMWSGSIGSIPTGWYLCDGTNGTPNLRDRFVVGAGTTYSVAATGGSKDSVVVSHTHTITDPTHSHAQSGTSLNIPSGNYAQAGGTNQIPYNPTSTAAVSTGISINTAGVSGTNANLPPYYALAFIMKS